MKKEDDEYIKSLVNNSTIKVDTSLMARQLKAFYLRKEFCRVCREQIAECPYNYDIIACIIGGDTEN